MATAIDRQDGQGIRTGKQYLEGLRDDRDVWMHGERVKDVTSHPGMSRGAHTLAGFMDRQFDPKLQDRITFEADGKRYATSYLVAKSKEDVVARGEAFYEWATWSNGMFGRTQDYKNASMTSFAGRSDM